MICKKKVRDRWTSLHDGTPAECEVGISTHPNNACCICCLILACLGGVPVTAFTYKVGMLHLGAYGQAYWTVGKYRCSLIIFCPHDCVLGWVPSFGVLMRGLRVKGPRTLQVGIYP